ncbi:MAG: trmB 1 [Planctomycetaceae bacterium]|nr:trmB 1 [Planctomycetaceae bacterium]
MPPKPQKQREREFGVPVPGEILEPERWTQTALKKIPDGLIDWLELFGRRAPILLDLGCGNGRFLLGSAAWRPDVDHFGTDVLPVVIRYATRRGNQRGNANLRFGVIGGRELLAQHVAPGSVSEIHCYHPQPYYEPREIGKRLITPEFLALVHRSLEPGGKFVLQTDNPGYWKYMRQIVPLFFDFEEFSGTWPDSPRGRTRREIIALQEGLPVFRGSGMARKELSFEAALALAEQLPPPVFNADRRLQALDARERESGGK